MSVVVESRRMDDMLAPSRSMIWRRHARGSMWTLWTPREGLPATIGALVADGDWPRDPRPYPLDPKLRRLLGGDPAWSASPTYAELRALADDSDWLSLLDAPRAFRRWAIGPCMFDARLVACALDMVPEVSRLALEVLSDGQPFDPATANRALALVTPGIVVFVAPLTPGGVPEVVLTERKGKLVAVPVVDG